MHTWQTPQILCLTWCMCAVTCITCCLVRGMFMRHLGLTTAPRIMTNANKRTLSEAATSSIALLTAYKHQAPCHSWEVPRCDRQGKIFFLGKHLTAMDKGKSCHTADTKLVSDYRQGKWWVREWTGLWRIWNSAIIKQERAPLQSGHIARGSARVPQSASSPNTYGEEKGTQSRPDW